MSKQTQRKKLDVMKTSAIKAYGPRSAAFGSEHYVFNAVSTGSLMLDYKLGTGGVIYGGLVEVFGANGLGKSSALLYGTLANVQKEEKLAALLATEPIFDKKWAAKLGLDPDFLLILRPENAQEAFDIMRDLVFNTDIDFIGMDSLGAMGNESSRKRAAGPRRMVSPARLRPGSTTSCLACIRVTRGSWSSTNSDRLGPQTATPSTSLPVERPSSTTLGCASRSSLGPRNIRSRSMERMSLPVGN